MTHRHGKLSERRHRLKKRIRRIERALAATVDDEFAVTLRAALERVRLYLRAVEIEQTFKQT